MTCKKILFICGSLNQTSMMHKISKHLRDHDCRFTPFYCDGVYRWAQTRGLLDWTIIGGQNREFTEKYLNEHGLTIDYAGSQDDYDLVLTCTDLLIQENIRDKPLVLVQEGMTDPENLIYHIVRALHRYGMPRWLASTATTGLSDEYARFCVASEGYRALFRRKGVREEKLVVTGIPNFDNAAEYLDNDFPRHGYILVATTDTRENFKWDNRPRFIRRAKEIAAGREMIFKLHPNEDFGRSAAEIHEIVPDATVIHRANTNHLIANCSVLVTQYSSVSYVGLALGKEVHSYFDIDELRELLPLQNGGASARNIAAVCEGLIA